MNCKDARKLLEEEVLVDLEPAQMASLRHHAESCPKCARLLADATRRDAALTSLLSELEPATESKPAASTWSGFRRGYRWQTAFGSVVLGFAGGFVFGPGKALPQAHASAIEEVLIYRGVLNEAIVGPSAFIEGFESGLDGWDLGPSVHNYVASDSTVRHGGQSSLKLYNRSWGGVAMRHFDCPIPKGATVRLAYWLLTPKGGTPNNKWFSSSINTDAEETMDLDVLDPNPSWRPVTFAMTCQQVADGFTVHLATGAGHGAYQGFDWATWVDDVRVYVGSLVESASWKLYGDRLEVNVVLPEPYTAEDVDLGHIVVWTIYGDFSPVRAESAEVNGEALKLVFRSNAVAHYLRTKKTDEGRDAPLDVVFPAKRGDLPCVFTVATYGTEGTYPKAELPTAPEATAKAKSPRR